MESSAKTKKKKAKNSGGGAQYFLVWHGEKIAVAAVVLVAAWLAMQGLGYLGQAVPWQPDDLQRTATEAETAIRNSVRSAEDEGVELFDFAAHAEHIKEPVPATPYRGFAPWNPEQRWRPPPPSAAVPGTPAQGIVPDPLEELSLPQEEFLEEAEQEEAEWTDLE